MVNDQSDLMVVKLDSVKYINDIDRKPGALKIQDFVLFDFNRDLAFTDKILPYLIKPNNIYPSGDNRLLKEIAKYIDNNRSDRDWEWLYRNSQQKATEEDQLKYIGTNLRNISPAKLKALKDHLKGNVGEKDFKEFLAFYNKNQVIDETTRQKIRDKVRDYIANNTSPSVVVTKGNNSEPRFCDAICDAAKRDDIDCSALMRHLFASRDAEAVQDKYNKIFGKSVNLRKITFRINEEADARKKFIMNLAKTREADLKRVLTKEYKNKSEQEINEIINAAKQYGKCPKGFNVHHQFPRALKLVKGNGRLAKIKWNDPDNFLLIPNRYYNNYHQRLHEAMDCLNGTTAVRPQSDNSYVTLIYPDSIYDHDKTIDPEKGREFVQRLFKSVISETEESGFRKDFLENLPERTSVFSANYDKLEKNLIKEINPPNRTGISRETDYPAPPFDTGNCLNIIKGIRNQEKRLEVLFQFRNMLKEITEYKEARNYNMGKAPAYIKEIDRLPENNRDNGIKSGFEKCLSKIVNGTDTRLSDLEKEMWLKLKKFDRKPGNALINNGGNFR